MDNPTVVFTFDDGWLDGYVWQMMFNLPATYFIPTITIVPSLTVIAPQADVGQPLGEDHYKLSMNRGQMFELAKRDCEIASHGHRHLKYNVIDDDVTEQDLAYSRDILKQFGDPVSFAFPGQADGHKGQVRRYFKYVRPNMGFRNPMESNASVWLYMWHRAVEQQDAGPQKMCLYCKTRGLLDAGARFITFRQACEEGLISGD